MNLYLFVYDLAKSVRHAQYLYFLLMAFVVLLNNFVILSFDTFDTNPCLSFSYIGIVVNIILLFGHSSLTIWTNKSILEVWVSVLIHVHFDSFSQVQQFNSETNSFIVTKTTDLFAFRYIFLICHIHLFL